MGDRLLGLLSRHATRARECSCDRGQDGPSYEVNPAYYSENEYQGFRAHTNNSFTIDSGTLTVTIRGSPLAASPPRHNLAGLIPASPYRRLIDLMSRALRVESVIA